MEKTVEVISKLNYRLFEESDMDGILRLWKEESGWGEITTKQFNDWYINTPYGRCLIIVAADDENKIAAQIVYSPSRMIVDNKEIKTLRGSAPILSSTLRQSNLRTFDHPAFGLIKKGFEVASEKGFQYIYTFPSYGWLGMLQLFPRLMPNPCETVSYDCFAISLEETHTLQTLKNDYYITISSVITDEYDTLWQDAIQEMPVKCGIARHSNWLQFGMGPNLLLETRRTSDNKLIGYMILKKDTGLIADILARNETDLKNVFLYSINAIHHKNAARIPIAITQLKVMHTKNMEPVINKIGFLKDNYRFAFGGYLLDTTIDFEKIKAENWYMTPLG
jgi:hypothetical protein